MNDSNIDGEEQLLSKFCDFEAMAKKWGVEGVQEVKYLLRLSLTRKYVAEAEANAVKKRREAEKIN